jgi:predicted N-acyltransferase
MSQALRQVSANVGTRISPPSLSVYQEARPPKYEARVWHSADEIDIAQWDRLRDPQDIFMDVRLLRAVEISMAQDATFRYVLFRDEAGTPAASACLCTYSVDGTVLANEGLARRLANGLKRLSQALVMYRIVFCGLPFSGGQSHLRFAPGVDHGAILASLDGMLEAIAREDRAKCIVLKEFQDQELPALESAAGLGYLRADSLPMNQLPLHHTSWEAHLASRNHKKRNDIRKSLKKIDEAGLRLITTSDPEVVDRLFDDDAHRLYSAVVARSETKLEMLPPAFFREMVRQLPGNCEISFALDGETVLGFGLSLYTETEYHPLFLGVDYDRNRDCHLYFNLMYRSLADALRRQTKLILLGQNADECKTSKTGSHQTPRHFYIKGVGFVMENVIRILRKPLFPPRPVTVPFGSPDTDQPDR